VEKFKCPLAYKFPLQFKSQTSNPVSENKNAGDIYPFTTKLLELLINP